MMREAELNQLKQQFGIVGNATSLNRAIEVATQVAPTALSVLITGESGTGKESFSKLIHKLSPYKHGHFIALNCGAIPEGTIDSELFGHEKGAFTGASEARKGYFEEANGGTIFLDEIGDMPLNTQTKLLRVLEYGEFIKVGSSKIQKTKVRVIAATNINLMEAVEQGKFREDLYYRLNTVPIRIPPLRERGQDILRLFAKFATEFSDQYYIKPIQLTEEAQKILLAYRFPGNIRQLKNLVEQMSVLEVDRTVTREKLLQYLPQEQQGLTTVPIPSSNYHKLHDKELLYKIFFELKKDVDELKSLVFKLINNQPIGNDIAKSYPGLLNNPSSLASPTPSAMHLLEAHTESKQKPAYIQPSEEISIEEEDLSIAEKEKELITKALKKYNSKRKKAAESLGISERTLYRKINQYDLEKTL
jgi:transcriptional regulator with PAS, ATPase and Fis domain